ncbi:MAG: hypothetical protein WD532_02580 [Acidimicrobiia bacterium]
MHTHRFDPISFIFGLAFLALALMFTLPRDPWDLLFAGVNLGWLWPVVITAAGVALLVPIVRTDRESDTEPDQD